ncbi:MAG: hypothetical protein JWQ88_2698 [Rhodoferax sp.]|nr:hypothetical protein [Rhodoferax sp.]
MAQPLQFDANLTEVEQLVEKVSAALLSGHAPQLELHSKALRDAMMALSGMAPSQKAVLFGNPAMKGRIEKVALSMARQREGMARRAVVVDRALSAVLPRAESATYAGVGKPAYRNNIARIYASAAT